MKCINEEIRKRVVVVLMLNGVAVSTIITNDNLNYYVKEREDGKKVLIIEDGEDRLSCVILFDEMKDSI